MIKMKLLTIVATVLVLVAATEAGGKLPEGHFSLNGRQNKLGKRMLNPML